MAQEGETEFVGDVTDAQSMFLRPTPDSQSEKGIYASKYVCGDEEKGEPQEV